MIVCTHLHLHSCSHGQRHEITRIRLPWMKAFIQFCACYRIAVLLFVQTVFCRSIHRLNLSQFLLHTVMIILSTRSALSLTHTFSHMHEHANEHANMHARIFSCPYLFSSLAHTHDCKRSYSDYTLTHLKLSSSYIRYAYRHYTVLFLLQGKNRNSEKAQSLTMLSTDGLTHSSMWLPCRGEGVVKTDQDGQIHFLDIPCLAMLRTPWGLR